MLEPIGCETCGLTPNSSVPDFDLWKQRLPDSPGIDKLDEPRDFGLCYYNRDGDQITALMWMWLRTVNPGYKIIRHTHRDDILISTVLLGIDHAFHFHTGPPIIFETMVFGIDGWTDYQERYHTEAEAEAGHGQVLAAIDAGISAWSNDE